MTHTDIHVRSRSDAEVRSESYAAATRQGESRVSTARVLPLNFPHRTKLWSTSARGCRTFFYLIVVSQILLVTTASITRQPQDVNDARNQTEQPRLSTYKKDDSIPSTSTISEPSSWSVPAPRPTPLRSAATKRSLYSSSLSSSSSSSSSSSLSSSQTTSPPVEESTLLTPLPLTAAMPPSKPASPSSHVKTPTRESTTQVERRVTRTANPNTSQPPSSSIPTEHNDLDEKENPDDFIAIQTFRKRDLVYLKHQMDYQRQEIRQLRLKLTQNDNQMTGLQREFREFRKQQEARNGGSTLASSTTGKDTQTISATLSLSSPEFEQKSVNPHEPLLPFKLLQKEKGSLTGDYINPVTSDPLPQQATSLKTTKTIPTDSKGETLSKTSKLCLECSKSELRLIDLQKDFESFQKKVNATFNAILVKLALSSLDSPEVTEVAESLKQKSDPKIKKSQEESADDKTVIANDNIVSRKLDGVKSGHWYDAIIVPVYSKQRSRARTEEENVPSTAHGASKSSKYYLFQKWSPERDSERKVEHKEKIETTKEEDMLDDVIKEDGNYRFSEDIAPELESINQKVQLVSDHLEDLEDQLVSVKENTSLSIKYLKDTLRGNISLLESYINQLRTDDERRASDEEKILKLHTLSDHTIKESGQRSFSKKNDTGIKEKEHSSTNPKKKSSNSPLTKIVPQARDVTNGGDTSKFSEKSRFQLSGAESIHRNFSWLFENVQSIQNKISNLDNTVSELSSTLSKLAVRFPFEVEQKNETIDKMLSAATEKSTSDHLGRLLIRWPTAIRARNKSISKDEQQPNMYEIPEQETNSSQGVTTEKILAVNQSEQWKSGSQMISDSAEQFPEATHSMLEALISWINDLDAQIQKLKMAVAGMKTRIIYMLSMVEQLYSKDTEREASVKDEAENRDDVSLLLNSTLARTLQTKKGNALPPASSAPSLTTSISRQPTTSTAPLTNISDIHERFLGNRSTASFENSGVDMPDSITQNYQHYNFTELDSFESNKSITVAPTPKLNVSTQDDTKETANALPANVRITVSRTSPSKVTGSLETVVGNVQDLLKRVKKLESQVLDLNEEKLLDSNESGLHIQTDYPGSGTTEDTPVATLEMVNKIALNMSKLQNQIVNIKRNMTVQENQLNAVKNDVFILDESMVYLGRELSDLELKQRRDDRYYHSQQINEANLSLAVVADQVSQILIPKQQLVNQNLKELNDSLNMQWTVLNRLKETTTQQETNISRISQNLHFSKEKILYVDLSKRRYRIYNSTSGKNNFYYSNIYRI